MAIRNFWMEGHVDGRVPAITGGPRSKDGGMKAVFHMRNKGGSRKALAVYCIANDDGTLQIDVFDSKMEQLVYQIKSER